ncbi:PQQ-binding-like beta-propeller repeat protein [Chitinophaga sp. G-6-1-13]|uniref:PQQ-binding-like beta-propeller repeat protein n=1 Tax=Chitinophaga fulva TaxID=2728842 RepID=A0A848GR56_9BACT|nr:PQQ-binding-like beta-propeller repeat protein [Chitinophaga fulva]NML40874.1 PQQ-binding-like beta-propeller repeat protein [Chitinophaga fulva]
MKYFFLLSTVTVLTLCRTVTMAQNAFKFALMTDIHVGSDHAAEDVQRSVADINQDPSIAFVIISGDITEFGADEELKLAKRLLDSLNKPWYIIPGNHDTKWSESGGNTFRRVFGNETFSFKHGGYWFIGTNCGPNMRMGPGQVPRENVVWLDNLLKTKDTTTPIIYINHYPQNADLNNWYEALDRLKQHNIQLILCGHGHTNKTYDFENIPGVMCRSNLRAKDSIGGYNIITVANHQATFEERTPLIGKNRQWTVQPLKSHHARYDAAPFERPSFAMNDSFPRVKALWTFQDNSDIGSGMALVKDLVISTNTAGEVYALHTANGKKQWSFKTRGKVYATPVVTGDNIVVASSDHYIYCIQASNGKQCWRFETGKPVVASAQIANGIAYVGASDGHFRAIDVATGKLVWEFTGVNGFVEDKPLIYQGNVYFGSWGNDFYALDAATGALKWKWNNGASNRMFSPAACYPVGAQGKVFIVAPDRYMTAFDSQTGNVIWRKTLPGVRMRESIGLAADSSQTFIKTMDGNLYGVSATADTMQLLWKSPIEMSYELNPAAAVERDGVIFTPTHSGVVYAVNRKDYTLLWKHKLSNCLVNAVLPIGNRKVLVSTMDGKLACIGY